MYNSGEKPGKGLYQCTNCGEVVELDDITDTLPVCPVCRNTTWNKIK